MKYEDDKLGIEQFEKMAKAYHQALAQHSNSDAITIDCNLDTQLISSFLTDIYCNTDALGNVMRKSPKQKHYILAREKLDYIIACLTEKVDIEIGYIKINKSLTRCIKDIVLDLTIVTKELRNKNAKVLFVDSEFEKLIDILLELIELFTNIL